jgi:hypothetical protein
MDYEEEMELDLTPLNVLHVLLGDPVLATKCLTALEEGAKAYQPSTNQVPAIVFLTNRCMFEVIDLWDERDAEEVM